MTISIFVLLPAILCHCESKHVRDSNPVTLSNCDLIPGTLFNCQSGFKPWDLPARNLTKTQSWIKPWAPVQLQLRWNIVKRLEWDSNSGTLLNCQSGFELIDPNDRQMTWMGFEPRVERRTMTGFELRVERFDWDSNPGTWMGVRDLAGIRTPGPNQSSVISNQYC